jgi:predicted Zn-dependent protease
MLRPSLLRSLLSTWLALHLIAGGVVRAESIVLPDLGDESLAAISPAQERKLGEDFMRQARRSLRFVEDPEINDYIQRLGLKLVAHSEATQKDFRFFVVEDATINAFAIPGGFVGVHTGLILHTDSESELASVMAHETAHVTQRHIPRLIVEEQRIALPAMAALLASILLAGSGRAGGEAGIALTTAAVAQKGINFTRTFEEEADRIGMNILAQASFDPRAMPVFFERLQSVNRYNDDVSLPEFLRTHPVTINRIADARNRAERLPRRNVVDSSEFHHVRAKLRALASGNPVEIARGFRDNLTQGKYRDADAERYGYALALMRSKDMAGARTEIGKLLARYPNRPYYRIAQADGEMAAGRFSEGVALYAAAYRKTPDSLPIARQYAAALLKTDQARTAKAVLKPLLRANPDDPGLYKMMAAAAGAAGARVEAHQALAEHYYLSGNPGAAVEQLQIAGRFAGDNFYLQSSIEARLKAIKEEMATNQNKKP